MQTNYLNEVSYLENLIHAQSSVTTQNRYKLSTPNQYTFIRRHITWAFHRAYFHLNGYVKLAPIQVSLLTQMFEFHINFTNHKLFVFYFYPQSLKNIKNYISRTQAIQSRQHLEWEISVLPSSLLLVKHQKDQTR